MFGKIMEFFNIKKKYKYIPEEDYVNYEDLYISKITKLNNEEETKDEFLE